jgi:hypothetical protein
MECYFDTCNSRFPGSDNGIYGFAFIECRPLVTTKICSSPEWGIEMLLGLAGTVARPTVIWKMEG